MSAGDHLAITLPDSEAELKASVEPAPSAGKSLTFSGRTGVFSPSFPQTHRLDTSFQYSTAGDG